MHWQIIGAGSRYYGKTTAVLDWLEKSGLPSAWVSIGPEYNDPVVLWRYICAALDSMAENISGDTAYVFTSQELLRTNIHLNIIIDRLTDLDDHFLLILDDVHLITNPVIMEGLSYLITYLPPRMHMVLISRTEPELSLAKLGVKGYLTRLGVKDLLFQAEEISQFYKARGFGLKNEDFQNIKRYSEGWAAALVAVAMSMEDDRERHRVLCGFASCGAHIDQYLQEEVFSAWPEEKQAFFMKTSILDTLCGTLCDAVAGHYNSNNLLKEINEKNGFLIALDDENNWYRYHHIFKDFLYKRLDSSDRFELADLHQKAADWYQANGFIAQAIDHYLKGSRYDKALKLIEQKLDDIVNRGDYTTAFSWIDRLPEDYRDNSLEITCTYALYYAEMNRFARSREWIYKAEALAAGRKYTTDRKVKEYAKTLCYLSKANLVILEGNIDIFPSLIKTAAEANADRVYKMSGFRDVNMYDIYFSRCPMNKLGQLYGKDPDVYQGMIMYYRTMISNNPGYAPLAAGEYLYESNRLDEALPYLLTAMEEALAAGCPGALVPSIVTIARLKRAQGDINGAVETVEECQRMLQSYNKPHWSYLLKAYQTRLYIDAGNIRAAEKWFASCKLGIYQKITRTREFEMIVFARFLIAMGRLGDGDILLRRLLAFSVSEARLHSTVEILNLLAIAAGKKGKDSEAAAFLKKSLAIGMEEGYVRSFVDELEPMSILLNSFVTEDVNQQAYAETLLIQATKDIHIMTASREMLAADLNMLFTPQEHRVLQLLVDGYKNSEIAEQLGISLRTVKAHTGSIYRKLQVKTRVQCINQARENGLLV